MINLHKRVRNVAFSLVIAGGMAGFCGCRTGPRNVAGGGPQRTAAIEERWLLQPRGGRCDGPMTHTAIRKYQSDNDLTVNGRLDTATRNQLGIRNTAIRPPAPLPMKPTAPTPGARAAIEPGGLAVGCGHRPGGLSAVQNAARGRLDESLAHGACGTVGIPGGGGLHQRWLFFRAGFALADSAEVNQSETSTINNPSAAAVRAAQHSLREKGF